MEKEKLTALVEKAKSGNPNAIEDLLCQAHISVSYQCRKMLPNVQDAEDLTQEILLTVYQKLHTLQEPAAFWGWLSRITATRCMNAISRTHVDLQFAEDEDGNSVLDSLETLDERQIPDKAIDNAETARMLDEIVSGLPEAQRLSTLLYYYDEMSVKEIAQIMGVGENTVKGRLNLARKAIKEKVQDYEKKGVKLYGISVLPLLWYFLRSAARIEADTAAATACAAKVMAVGTANSAAEATTTAGTTVTRVAGVFSKKVIAGIIAGIVVVGGAAVAAVQIINEFAGTVPAVICQHEWSEANCTSAITCHKCGSTEGAALGHKWADADCVNPKTCTVCGMSEGEALGHEWIAANYQEPKTCSVCGVTEGEALPAYFETNGLNVVFAEMGVEYDYVTSCYGDNSDKKTVGKLVFSDYRVFEGDEFHEALDGYVWHTVTAKITFSDNNAWNYGMMVWDFTEDYYEKGDGWSIMDVSVDNENYISVNYKGVEYDKCKLFVTEDRFLGWDQTNKSNTYLVVYHWRMPAGYDGFIQGYIDSAIEWEEGQYTTEFADENTLFFRFGSGNVAE